MLFDVACTSAPHFLNASLETSRSGDKENLSVTKSLIVSAIACFLLHETCSHIQRICLPFLDVVMLTFDWLDSSLAEVFSVFCFLFIKSADTQQTIARYGRFFLLVNKIGPTGRNQSSYLAALQFLCVKEFLACHELSSIEHTTVLIPLSQYGV